MLRAFYGIYACSLATGWQTPVRATYGFRKVCVRAPYGPMRIVRAWKHRVISHMGTVGACEYPFGQSCSKYTHGLYIPGRTLSCVIWLIRAPVRLVFGLVRPRKDQNPENSLVIARHAVPPCTSFRSFLEPVAGLGISCDNFQTWASYDFDL